MVLSDISIRRPVICLVASILIVLVGLLSFRDLPVREYPSIDSPTVSVETSYRGASAEVIETKVTEPLEKELASIEGIRVIRSSSVEEYSRISIEFNLDRNVDEAANDVRDRVSRVRGRLPREIESVQVSKADADARPIMSISFNSDRYTRLELSEMVERIALQRLQTVPGVAQAELRAPRYAMRLWVDSSRLAAHNLTIAEVENALRVQNIEIPGGRLESLAREFPVKVLGNMAEVAEYENLVLATSGTTQVKFSDVGRVELGASDYRGDSFFRGRPTVGITIQRQSQANLLEIAQGVKALLPIIQADLPPEVRVEVGYDTSVFVERSVREVYHTLWIAAGLVILMIFVFLRDWRATLIPLVAIPVSVIGTFAVMSWAGFTVNILTLLALVLAVGLVVDDAIVMLENIYRRIEEGEAPIQAAVHGARQVAFAIIATTLTLAAVFVPVAFQKGQTGRLFFEFGLTLAIAVLVSSFVALTLTPMLCSRLLKAKRVAGRAEHGWLYEKTEPLFVWLNARYEAVLQRALRHKTAVLLGALALAVGGFLLYPRLQRELTPQEDRGIFSATFIPPVGSTPEYAKVYSREMENIILAIPEIDRTFHRAGEGNSFMFATLKLWEDRERKTQDVIAEVRRKFQQQITGGQALAIPSRPFGGGGRRGGGGGGIEMVLQGSEFDKLQELATGLIDEMRQSPVFMLPRVDPVPTKPQLDVRVDRAKAADLRVPLATVASTLESLLGGRRVTQFQRGNQQYDVIVQVEDASRVTPNDLARIYVKSLDGHLVQLSNLVDMNESAVPESYPHFNRLRSVTVSAQIAAGSTLGDGVDFLQERAQRLMPPGYTFAWDGETRDFVESGSDTLVLFGLALLFTFLILAAQFESWIHPITIFTGVVIALAGGLLVLYCTRYWGPAMTDNLFSRFGLIMLIGLVAKNGILIVEFANQLQVEGKNAFDAAYEAATLRFRPILMTAISTILGAMPIAFATGAGAETRNPMGIVIVGGLSIATVLTLFVIPICYLLMDRLCVRLTGHSSAHGLRQAAVIARETRDPTPVAVR